MATEIDAEVVVGLLRVLNSCGSYPVRESILFTQYNNSALTVQPMATVREHLAHCKDKGWVDYLVDEIDRGRKWFITGEGKVALAAR